IALVIAAAIDSFVMAFLSPFVELYVLHEITTAVELVALAYLPSGIISAMLGGSIGRYADKANKVLIVSGAALIVSVCTFALAFLPQIIILLGSTFPMFVVGVQSRIIMIAVLFTFQGVAGTSAFMVMSSVLGTAYEGRANEGFGMFEAAMGLARFSGPLVGGILWDTYSPMTPFIFVGLAELLLIPAYFLGMKRYEQMLTEKGEEESGSETGT
ncbi:MAG: MFS transporter, partial [Candidatus Thorarchaeota archaeon]